MEILRVENLCKIYGDGENQISALRGLSFSVSKGEFVAVTGPSGSGKSTLLYLLGGVDVPTAGKVWLAGNDLYAKSREALAVFRRRQIGLIYQFYHLIPTLTVADNITLPLKLDGRRVNERRLSDLLELLQLTPRQDYLPKQLSGGEQQRVSIGRALIHAPALVLADEPTGSLDSVNSQNMIELLKYSNKKYKQTMIIITHDENIAMQADRIIEMSDGQIR